MCNAMGVWDRLVRLRQERHLLPLLFPRVRSVLDVEVTCNEYVAVNACATGNEIWVTNYS